MPNVLSGKTVEGANEDVRLLSHCFPKIFIPSGRTVIHVTGEVVCSASVLVHTVYYGAQKKHCWPDPTTQQIVSPLTKRVWFLVVRDLLPVASIDWKQKAFFGGAQRKVEMTLFNKPRREIYTESPAENIKLNANSVTNSFGNQALYTGNLNYTSSEQHQ